VDKSKQNPDSGGLVTDALTQHATQTGDRITYMHDIQKWGREISGKLYYPLWILFMGGFVLSLAPPDKTYSLAAHAHLIHTFRLLAILGSILNFLMQSVSINSTRLTGQMIMALDRYRIDISKGNIDSAESGLQEAERFHRQREQFSLANMILSICVETCAIAFLVLALIGTWNI
jgi:hypothetical protein